MLEYIKERAISIWVFVSEWVKENDISIAGYLLKVFAAIIIFVIINDIIKKSFDKIGSKISGREVAPASIRVGFGFIRMILLISLLSVLMNYLSMVEVHPLFTVTVSACVVIIFVFLGILPKAIENAIQAIVKLVKGDNAVVVTGSRQLYMPKVQDYSPVGIKIRRTVSFIYKITGIVIALILVFVGYEGISYVTESGGHDISVMLNMPEQYISGQLNTEFKDDDGTVSGLPIYIGDDIKIRTDGELNIVYLHGKQIGVHTSGRAYRFFNVAVNQPEIPAVREMTYKYEKSKEILKDVSRGVSHSFVYYNESENTALVLTVNAESNRIVSMTYYSDLMAATNMVSLDDY